MARIWLALIGDVLDGQHSEKCEVYLQSKLQNTWIESHYQNVIY
jgi:hypothetical protein